MSASINYIAGDNVRPMVFCSNDTHERYAVVQADGTQPIVGISQMGTQGSPGTPFDTGFAAASGRPINVFQDEDHDEPLLILGASVTGGQLLKSDANGFGTPVSYSSSSTQFVGAEARDSGASGQAIRVRLKLQVLAPTA